MSVIIYRLGYVKTNNYQRCDAKIIVICEHKLLVFNSFTVTRNYKLRIMHVCG